ncbi:MAG: 2Fe-2S iron-sulfur cluster binding domain-containing protein [Desulfobacterales bacterium]|jgi:Na+-transporting NADH:ubiquinone oxidoreductase subunit F|nr:2Fe-2S iron-sulfur cluster binding domain-containing protein [Desulfobacteraceae bacterium]MBT7087066.1 2Fe-2S iron-sulfur cluster binding domain-containing protein [Desulfobacterales bacterium]MBT7696823.1 2Fe-2S iron-sulfur cluster binding domain-containing protein [Desulfobacterales bacterium]
MIEQLTQIFFSLLILSGIAALLAFLIEVAHAYIADYGECQLSINNEKELTVKGGSPLLFTLMEEEIYIPSACGGKGSCSLCKLKVVEGGGPVLPTETPYLCQEEIENNVRLSCQIKVKNDLKIEIPEELFLIREFNVKVDRIEELTHEINGLHLTVQNSEEGLNFKPGQYAQLKIPKYTKTKQSEYRAYSIASAPKNKFDIRLLITKVPSGAVSTYVHDYLKKGQDLKMTGAFGDFYLRDSDRDILMIATGSGLAPFLSMLHHIKDHGITRNTVLFFGDKATEDLLCMEEISSFETTLPNFTFKPILSRVKDKDKWKGEKGRVTDLIEKHVVRNSSIDVYICGAPVMVKSCMDLLAKKGIPEECIMFDKFE